MKLAKLTASTAALLLSSTALMAQEAQSQSYQSVFIDVGGTAVLVPLDVALEACALDEPTLQTAFQGRLDDSGIDQTQFMAQMDMAMGSMNMGDAASQDTAAAGTGDASGAVTTDGTASADAAAGTTGEAGSTDMAAADASGTAAGTDASGMASDTTQTADANATTDSGNATTDMGNATDTADASGAAAGDASATGAADAGTTDTATADASGAAGQDATATGEVQNVESTAADTSGAAAGANADPFLVLAACQIDATRASELQIDTTRTGTSLGFDAATLGIESGVANQ